MAPTRKHDGSTAPAAVSDSEFLTALGQQVRRIRAIHGMSRKVLAKASGISERYIAQLESGDGNVSIMLLRRIAAATGTTIGDLVGHDEPRADEWKVIRDLLRTATPAQIARATAALRGDHASVARPSLPAGGRVALIGLRGAGKSSLGRLASDKLGWPFVELNREIEGEAGLAIGEIFNLYGQEGYHRLEQAALRKTVAQRGPMILATGGGIVADPVTFDLLLSSFFTVWVKADPADHMSRVRNQGDLRPMGRDRAAMKELVAILTSREPLYARAHAIVDTSGATPAQSADTLLSLIRENANLAA